MDDMKHPAEEPKLWKCGEPYSYPVPTPGKDPWDVVLEACMKKDKRQCDAWKDEVQNLLIFSGLFSAVVTSFVVDSCKSLRMDSSEQSVILLSRLSDHFGANGNATAISVDELPFSPSAAVIRINIFWFLSLVFSLTVVLIGIVSLQWLREHQRYSDTLPPTQTIAIFNMRAAAMERWHVPQVFASLPLLLQAALLLFFAGMVDFLVSLSPIVAIIVTIALAIPIIFIILTTILPTLQCYAVSIRLPLSNSPTPCPCPYKSPQSHAFRLLVTSSRTIFELVHRAVVRTLFTIQSWRPRTFSNLAQKEKAWLYRLLPDSAYHSWAHKDWIEFDRMWTLLRNEHFDITRRRKSGDPDPQPLASSPIFDAIASLAVTAQGNEHRPPVIYAVYYCFQEMLDSVLRDTGDYTYAQHHLQACYRDLVAAWNSPIANLASMLQSPPQSLLREVNTALFLRLPGIYYQAINPSQVIGRHMLEIYTRILVHVYAEQPRRLLPGTVNSSTGFFHWYTINIASLDHSPIAQEVFLQQFFTLFRSFVDTASSVTSESSVARTFHTHSDVEEFITLASHLTWHLTERTSDVDSKALTTLLSTFDKIEAALTSSYSSSKRHDFLFCCTAAYLKRIWDERPTPIRVKSSNLPTLTVYSLLLSRLDHLQRNVVLRYEEDILGAQELSPVIAKIVPPHSLPSLYFLKKKRDFTQYAGFCGLMDLTQSRRMSTLVNSEPFTEDDDDEDAGGGGGDEQLGPTGESESPLAVSLPCVMMGNVDAESPESPLLVHNEDGIELGNLSPRKSPFKDALKKEGLAGLLRFL